MTIYVWLSVAFSRVLAFGRFFWSSSMPLPAPTSLCLLRVALALLRPSDLHPCSSCVRIHVRAMILSVLPLRANGQSIHARTMRTSVLPCPNDDSVRVTTACEWPAASELWGSPFHIDDFHVVSPKLLHFGSRHFLDTFLWRFSEILPLPAVSACSLKKMLVPYYGQESPAHHVVHESYSLNL